MDVRQIQKGREEICRISAMLFAKGLVSGKDGNISVRISADEMLVTPSGVCKAFLEPEMILRQRFDGTVVEGELRSTREAGMHSRLYELRPEIGAIVHTHPAAATAFAVCGEELPQDILLEVPALLGKTAVAGYAPAGSRELIAEVEKCAKSDVILLQNHGVITCGSDLADAFARMDAAENAARTIIYARLLGEPKRMPAIQP
jgi:L-fuculose-phosphate aldolase